MRGLTEEQKKQFENAGSKQEKIELLKKMKMELPDEALEKVSGGAGDPYSYDVYGEHVWFCNHCQWYGNQADSLFIAIGSDSNRPNCPVCGTPADTGPVW